MLHGKYLRWEAKLRLRIAGVKVITSSCFAFQVTSWNVTFLLTFLSLYLSVKLIRLQRRVLGLCGGIESMKIFFSLTVNPTKAPVSPARAGNFESAAQQNECHPAGRVLSSSFPLTLTLPSGKTDDTNEGRLLVSWRPTHTHCSYCATLSPLPPGSHRHCSLHKHTHGYGQKQVASAGAMTRDCLTARLFDASWGGMRSFHSTSCCNIARTFYASVRYF